MSQFLESEFASWMYRYKLEYPDLKKGPLLEVHQDPPDSIAELIKQKGIEHEAAVIEELRMDTEVLNPVGPSNEEKIKQTMEYIRNGRDTIYQAALQSDNIFGKADIIRKVMIPSKLGDYSYEPWDIKIASHPKPYAIIQLCVYCDILKHIQGIYPEHFKIITVDRKVHEFRTLDYIYFYQAFKKHFFKFHADFDVNQMPIPSKTAQHWDWNVFARKLLHLNNDVSMTANIRMSNVQTLKKEGIETLNQLSAYQGPKPKNIPATIFKKLKEQAAVQVASIGKSVPEYIVLAHEDKRCGLAMLPDSTEWDIFFDMEGYPLLGEDGLEYLE